MPPGRRLRPVALALITVLIAATLTAGARLTYCAMMGPLAATPCACPAPKASRGLTLEVPGCQRVVTVGSLPPTIQAAAGTAIPLAPESGFVAFLSGREFAQERRVVLAAWYHPRQRAGPLRPADDERVRRMVFLL
jgi:hypothetical protein